MKNTKSKAKVSDAVKTYVKKMVEPNPELRYFDYRVTAEQVINNQLSNSSASYYSDPCDVPLYSGSASTSMEAIVTGKQSTLIQD